mmetsp:Transcript_357/g.1196  ORF Transcript_357/g.1196 Transcript_357/m.1196 type:complete len:207 (-) Transcript_357:248-868(-)
MLEGRSFSRASFGGEQISRRLKRLSMRLSSSVSSFTVPRQDEPVMTDGLFKMLCEMSPVMLPSNRQLVFSSQNGNKSGRDFLKTARRKSRTLLVVEDCRGNVFGAFVSSPWKKLPHRFYGSGESFLFRALPQLEVFPYTRRNSLIQYSDGASLGVGGGEDGGHFGLFIDSNLSLGSSALCDTFANSPLADGSESFEVQQVELWVLR